MMHALIVGDKGIGKSTLIDKVLMQLSCEVRGYLTVKETVQDDNGRYPVYIYEYGKAGTRSAEKLVGFSDGKHSESYPKVFDRNAVILQEARRNADIIVMDEIGIMERSADTFCAEVLKCLDGVKPVLAAVKSKPSSYLERIRKHPNCRVFYITEENREELVTEVFAYLKQSLQSGAEKSKILACKQKSLSN